MAFSLIGRRKSKQVENRLVLGEEYQSNNVERIFDSYHTVKTIYVDGGVRNGWVCNYCEGENSQENMVCCICGNYVKTD